MDSQIYLLWQTACGRPPAGLRGLPAVSPQVGLETGVRKKSVTTTDDDDKNTPSFMGAKFSFWFFSHFEPMSDFSCLKEFCTQTKFHNSPVFRWVKNFTRDFGRVKFFTREFFEVKFSHPKDAFFLRWLIFTRIELKKNCQKVAF